MSKEDFRKEKCLKELTAKALKKLTAAEMQQEVYGVDQVKRESKSVFKHRNTNKKRL